MSKGVIAKATVSIYASSAKVWEALTNPDLIKQYMFGTTVVTDWNVGSPIIWKGEWQGKQYEDKGKVLQFEPGKLLEVTHFSPLSGVADIPENYHTVTYALTPDGENTVVTLTQDNNASEEEKEHSERNWSMMLGSIKTLLEK